MKIRHGFVSNSSSSSFIIGFKKSYNNDYTCPACGNATNIFKIIEAIEKHSCETEIRAKGLDEILNKYDDTWNSEYKEEIKEKLEKFLADKNTKDYELMLLSVDNNDSFLKELIKNDKNIIILDGDVV